MTPRFAWRSISSLSHEQQLESVLSTSGRASELMFQRVTIPTIDIMSTELLASGEPGLVLGDRLPMNSAATWGFAMMVISMSHALKPT
jgi:hypothetical protein